MGGPDVHLPGNGVVRRRLLHRGLARRRARGGGCAPRASRHHGRVDRGFPARRHAGDRRRRGRRSRARHRDVRRAGLAAHLGTRARLVPRVRAPYRCAAHRRVPDRSRSLDPHDRESRSVGRGRTHRTAPLAAGARQCRHRRPGRRRPAPRLRRRGLRRPTDRRERAAPPAPRPPRIAALLGWLDRQEP